MLMSLNILGGRPDIRMPNMTPRGEAELNTMLLTMKILVLSLDWAMLRPRLKAIKALWIMTAMKMLKRSVDVSWSPMAMPSNTEWNDRAMSSIILRSIECWSWE